MKRTIITLSLALSLFTTNGLASVHPITTRDLRNAGVVNADQSFFADTLAAVYFAIAFIPF